MVPGNKSTHKKRQRTEFHVRLAPEDAAAADRIVEDKGFKSRNDLIVWLLRGYLKQREDLEEQMFAMIDRLEEHLSRKLQQINTVSQLNVALTDAFVRWMVTAMPDLPHDETALRRAKTRGFDHYRRIQEVAAKEFRDRRAKDVYKPDNWFTDEQGSEGGNE
jgi:hypothetical protein